MKIAKGSAECATPRTAAASNASRTLTAEGASSVSSTNVTEPFPSKQPVSRTPGAPQRHATIMSVLVVLEGRRTTIGLSTKAHPNIKKARGTKI